MLSLESQGRTLAQHSQDSELGPGVAILLFLLYCLVCTAFLERMDRVLRILVLFFPKCMGSKPSKPQDILLTLCAVGRRWVPHRTCLVPCFSP